MLKILESILKSDKRVENEPLIKISILEQLHDYYSKYSITDYAKESIQRIRSEITQENQNVIESLKKIEKTIEIQPEQSKELIDLFFSDSQDARTIMSRLFFNFLPEEDSVRARFKEHKRKDPFQYACHSSQISDLGFTLSSSNINEDEYHFKKYFKDELTLSGLELHILCQTFKKKFPLIYIQEIFCNSLLFKMENKEYLEKSLEAYYEQNYLFASHLFLPIIETVLRELTRISGHPIVVPNKEGGFDRMLLGKILENVKLFEQVFSTKGEKVRLYFRFVLNDKLGMNLRNDFAHGFEKEKYFQPFVSHRLFQILCGFILIIEK